LGWLIDHIKQDFHIVFEDSALLNTVLGQENINSHFLSLLQELLFRVLEVAGELAWHQGLAHWKLLFELISLHFIARKWMNSSLAHELEQLARQFHQCFLCQKMRVVFKLVEGNELNDISLGVLVPSSTEKGLVVTIKCLHVWEVSISNTNNDNGHGVARTSHNLINCLSHVVNDTVCDDQQNLKLLVLEVSRICLNVVIHLVQNWSEMGRAIQINMLQTVLVVGNHFVEPINARVKDVAIHGKAVRSSLTVRRNCTAETIQVDKFVCIVELQNVSHWLDDF
jgi:hypothetical protein